IEEDEGRGATFKVVKEAMSFDKMVEVLDGFLTCDEYTEIVINSPDEVFLRKENLYRPLLAKFSSLEDYDRYLDLLVDRCVASGGFPYTHKDDWRQYGAVDGVFVLRYGEENNEVRVRADIVLPPIVAYPKLTMCRKRSRKNALSMDDLVRSRTLTEHMANLLQFAVLSRLNLIVSGSTGTGKTTMIQALLAFIPPQERVVIIEEEPELDPPPSLPNVVSLLTVVGSPSQEGSGPYTQRFALGDLVKHALYMRPQRIIVGEIRTEGALALVDALSTGHDGSITSVHSSSPSRAVERIINLCLREIGGRGIDKSVIGDEVCRVFHLGVHMTLYGQGRYLVDQITEIEYLTGSYNRVTTNTLWYWDYRSERHRCNSPRFSPYLEELLGSKGIIVPYEKLFVVETEE
ncbi:MAG: CpaF/VirB11 family protein, partial [Candidatus Hadarchaeales archaeon]